MRTVTLNYDEANDWLLDAAGMCVITGYSVAGFKDVEPSSTIQQLEIKDVCKLKEQGFDSKEIIEMHAAGVI